MASTPSSAKHRERLSTKSRVLATWGRTFLAKTILALPFCFTRSKAVCILKKEHWVGTPFLFATSTIFWAGSTPSTSYPFFIKGTKNVPSLLAISKTYLFFGLRELTWSKKYWLWFFATPDVPVTQTYSENKILGSMVSFNITKLQSWHQLNDKEYKSSF